MWLKALVYLCTAWKLCGQQVWAQSPPAAEWWRSGLCYRLLVDSFKDSDGDGIGDIKGVINNLGYVRSLGAQAVILSPLTAKSQDCSRQGTLTFVPAKLDNRLGTDQDFTAFLDKADKLELKVIVTLPLETISEASEWAVLSANRSAGYEDFLVWREGSVDDPPPTVEKDEEKTISWRWNDIRAAYLATDAFGEALLNSCASGVRAALAGALVSWLRRGAAGVLLQPDFHLETDCGRALVRDLTRAAADYARMHSGSFPVIMVESRLKWREAVLYYADEPGSVTGGADLVLYRDLVAGEELPQTAADFKVIIDRWITFVPPAMTPIWITASSFTSRVATRYGVGMIDAFNALMLLLPGVSLCYQGDELGLIDAVLERATPLPDCPVTRVHPANAPFSWDETANGGFTKGVPWLPLPDNYRYSNAKSQFSSNTSHAAIFRMAAELKQTSALGAHAEIQRLGTGSLGVLRWGGPSGSILIIVNVGTSTDEALISRFPGIPGELTVAISSVRSMVSQGDRVQTSRPLRMGSGDAIILVGGPRHCGGPGPVEKISSKISDAVQKINKYFKLD